MSGSVFMPTSVTPSREAPDPSKHVNYVLGMVLGVDDFTQEFAYLAGSDQRAARELSGSGVVRGLHVYSPVPPDADKGPEIVVSAGLAVTPEGRFVRVPLTQCAFLNEWINIEKNLNALKALPGVSPTPTTPAQVKLYVVLSYASHETDLVPIPGEPCRTEDESMAASRVTDDFKLELRLTPPERREELASRAYLEWLAAVPVTDAGTPLPAFLAAITDAAAKTPHVPVTPSVTPIFGAPPPSVQIPRAAAATYLREALALYPALRAAWLGAGATADGMAPSETAVLLAEVTVKIVVDSLSSSVWKVQSPQPSPATPPVVVDGTRRSGLVPLSFLRDAMLILGERASARSVELAGASGRCLVAATGVVVIKANEGDPVALPAPSNGLTAWSSPGAPNGEVTVKFNGPPGQQYVIKAMPIASTTNPAFSDPMVTSAVFLASGAIPAGEAPRFRLSVKNGGAPVPQATLVGQKLMIEVSAFGAA